MPTVQSATPYRQRKRIRGIFAALVCDVTSRVRNESTVLHMIRVAPWRRGAPKAQDGCASKRHPFYAATSMPTVQSATPCHQRKRSRESFAALVCDVTSRVRNESTVLHMIRAAPWRRGAPKAQDRCASKRHPSTQRPVCQLCKALLRIVIGSEFEGSLPHSYASKCVGRETKARYYMPYE